MASAGVFRGIRKPENRSSHVLRRKTGKHLAAASTSLNYRRSLWFIGAYLTRGKPAFFVFPACRVQCVTHSMEEGIRELEPLHAPLRLLKSLLTDVKGCGVVRASTARKVLSARSVFIGGVLAKAPWRNVPLCCRKSHFSRQRKRDRQFGFFVEIGLPWKMQNPTFGWHRFDMIGITGFKDFEIISHTA